MDEGIVEQEVELLRCVYSPEDIVVDRLPNGAIVRVGLTLMRSSPLAILFKLPQERQEALDEASTSSPSAQASGFVYAMVPITREEDAKSAFRETESTLEVPVGYVSEKPLEVTAYVAIPRGYPDDAPLTDIHIDSGGRLSREEQAEVTATLRETAASQGECASPALQAVMEAGRGLLVTLKTQQANALLAQLRLALESGEVGPPLPLGDADDEEAAMANAAVFRHYQLNPFRLGRRCIYFHHILATGKRMFIRAVSKKLQLQGLCKIGYPGILLVEGTEDACEIFVKLLQRLRWKLMVVRGEESEDAPLGVDRLRRLTKIMLDGGTPSEELDALLGDSKRAAKNSAAQARRQDSDEDDVCAPSRPRTKKGITILEGGVWETTSASEIGRWARVCDLEDLFRTSMKIYA